MTPASYLLELQVCTTGFLFLFLIGKHSRGRKRSGGLRSGSSQLPVTQLQSICCLLLCTVATVLLWRTHIYKGKDWGDDSAVKGFSRGPRSIFQHRCLAFIGTRHISVVDKHTLRQNSHHVMVFTMLFLRLYIKMWVILTGYSNACLQF